jgi:hypothetical protein
MHVHHKRLLIRIEFDANGGHVAVRDNLAHPPQSLFRWLGTVAFADRDACERNRHEAVQGASG